MRNLTFLYRCFPYFKRGGTQSWSRRWFVILKDNHSPSATVIMLGNFQQSQLRIEVEASETVIRDSLSGLCALQWLWPQSFAAGMPEQLDQGLTFTSWTGPVAIHHQVEVATPNCLLYSVKELTGFTNGTGEKAGCNLSLEGVSTAVEFGSNAQFATSASVLTAPIWHFWKTLIQ